MSKISLDNIAVEGPIGVGKTTLAKRLATHFGSALMLEGAAENPFLKKFYVDPARFALPTQLHFLFQRVEQLQNLRQDDLFRPHVVFDYMLEKDRLFASITLDLEEFEIYDLIYKRVVDGIAVPDLVIYLHAPVPSLVARIKRRGLDYEQSIDHDYLDRLCGSYVEFFRYYRAAPVLFVDTENVNFVDRDDHFSELLEHIDSGVIGQQHFVGSPATLET